MGVVGLEPTTLRLRVTCSNQLSYTPAFRSQYSITGLSKQHYLQKFIDLVRLHRRSLKFPE
jgi:hypothetical protein